MRNTIFCSPLPLHVINASNEDILKTKLEGHIFMSIEDSFEAGFEEGYKSIKGDMVLVPLCPLPPLTPLGSTDFREGIKAGIKAANR